jgi:acyl carrier protein
VEGWDSLAHINLVTNIEQEFNVRFALGELAKLRNVGEMVDLILVKSSVQR